MVDVFEAQQNLADAVSFGHVDGASSCRLVNSHSRCCQGRPSFVRKELRAEQFGLLKELPWGTIYRPMDRSDIEAGWQQDKGSAL